MTDVNHATRMAEPFPINSAVAGPTVVAPGLAGYRVFMVGFFLVCAAGVVLKWMSNTTDLSGLMTFGSSGGISVPGAPAGVLKTALGADLVLWSSDDVVVGGTAMCAYVRE